jgi:hypothetical protein
MTYRVRNPDLHQEDDELPKSGVIIAIVVTLVVSAVMIIWSVQATDSAWREQRPGEAFPERWLGPRHTVAGLRQDIFGERRGPNLKGIQRRELESYGVVDPARGIVRIPIQRAMELYLRGRRP